MKTLIIAEAGVNHNGDMSLAKKLVDIAAESGADLVKFQTFSADRLATHFAHKAEYQKSETRKTESQHAMLRKLELTEEMHVQLIAYCQSRAVGFLSTGFDIESVDLLNRLGQELFKIPSGEITNMSFLRHIGGLGKRVILSTGMSTMDEIESAISVLENSGTPRSKVTVLHCTTAYPAPMSDVNLSAMQSIKSALNVEIGYSDHTLGIEIPIAAVALGATVIEKHFTLDRNMPGPDHKASLEPTELKAMVNAIRNIERALGDGVKRLMPSEVENIVIARKSIVARQSISKGEIFSSENITAKRPNNGISAMQWDEVIGKAAKRDYSIDEFIEL